MLGYGRKLWKLVDYDRDARKLLLKCVTTGELRGLLVINNEYVYFDHLILTAKRFVIMHDTYDEVKMVLTQEPGRLLTLKEYQRRIAATRIPKQSAHIIHGPYHNKLLRDIGTIKQLLKKSVAPCLQAQVAMAVKNFMHTAFLAGREQGALRRAAH